MKRLAPSDAAAEAAWSQIMALAADNCLVVEAAGGVAILATPWAQRQEPGLRERVLAMELAEEAR